MNQAHDFAPGELQGDPNVLALLGPTNTGKTHRAIERMLRHRSGMLGLPLRLLAREVYDRITEEVGEGPVALITGEEKRVPKDPRYFVCTVEAMPMSRSVDFMAIDEIQLCAHPQRGHVFTDRLLHARGRLETWFMGAHTMRPLVEELIPEAKIVRHPRMSVLRSVGSQKLGNLPAQSAVVAFSAARVYELGERLKARRGGAAIVMGALSPRARNAQVALYQSGEVNYMVATDAIGMGLNLNVDHVSFADLSKYDGTSQRRLEVPELAQIAGRAGRYLRDGTFGTLLPERELPPPVVRAIETHHFYPLEQLYWRSPELDCSTVQSLADSLRTRVPSPRFRLAEQAVDGRVLKRLLERGEVLELAASSDRVRLLWEVCQIPDYRQILPEFHASLVLAVFTELLEHGRLTSEWLEPKVLSVDKADGDLDTLLARMAAIRTWTYVSHRAEWVESAEKWQEFTRAAEDRLSDALHLRLVERFVERGRTQVVFEPDRPELDKAGVDSPFRSLALLRKELAKDSPERERERFVERLIEAPFEDVTVDPRGKLHFEGREVGKLSGGQTLLLPEVLVTLPGLGAGQKSRVQRRLRAFAKDLVFERLLGKSRLEDAELTGAARGLAYQVEQALGGMPARDARAQLALLTEADRTLLRRAGIRIGRHVIYQEQSLDAAGLRIRTALCSAFEKRPAPDLGGLESVPLGPREQGQNASYVALGYWADGQRALRLDYVERLSNQLYRLVRAREPLSEALLEALGSDAPARLKWLRKLGFRLSEQGHLSLPSSKRRRRFRRARPS